MWLISYSNYGQHWQCMWEMIVRSGIVHNVTIILATFAANKYTQSATESGRNSCISSHGIFANILTTTKMSCYQSLIAVLMIPNSPTFDPCLICDFLIVYIDRECNFLYKFERWTHSTSYFGLGGLDVSLNIILIISNVK